MESARAPRYGSRVRISGAITIFVADLFTYDRLDVDLAASMLTNRLISATYDDSVPSGRGLTTQYGPDRYSYDARNRRTAYDLDFQRTEDYL